MTTDPVELKKLVKQLQSAPSPTEILNVLGILKSTQNVTEAILRETKAGLAVGKLRAHSSKEVADLAKEIVKKWKLAVEKAKQANGGSTPTSAAAKQNGKIDRKSSTPATPTATHSTTSTIGTTAAVKQGSVGQETRTAKSDGIKGGTGGKIRTVFVNLKDKSNPGLRESVVSGELAVEKLSRMSSSEMASEERKAADIKIKEQNLFKSLSAAEQQAETDAFQCSRCKQRKCSYLFDEPTNDSETLRSSALTRRAISPIALARSWREVLFLDKRIVPVINSYAPTDDKYVGYLDDREAEPLALQVRDTGYYANLSLSLPNCVKQYLSCIRYLEAYTFSRFTWGP
ncbi:Transcription elongation factor S-II [Leucoagaricus sp. SymC.cos]|nr:Transcription elongation factor S-II [Leucoagaricus sp. SymC.cos]